MVFVKGKRYRHKALDDYGSLGFEVIDIVFQCNEYADIVIRWIAKDDKDPSGTKLLEPEDTLRVDSVYFDGYYDIYH
jgi:hypothetical protein